MRDWRLGVWDALMKLCWENGCGDLELREMRFGEG